MKRQSNRNNNPYVTTTPQDYLAFSSLELDFLKRWYESSADQHIRERIISQIKVIEEHREIIQSRLENIGA